VQDPGARITKFLTDVLPQQHGGAGEAWIVAIAIIIGAVLGLMYGLYWLLLKKPAQAILYVYKLINKQKDDSRFLMYILIILSMKPGLTDEKKEEITKLWSNLVGHLVSTKRMYLVSYYGLILRFLTGGDGKVERGLLPVFVIAAAEDIETPDKTSNKKLTVYYSNLYKFPCYPSKMYALSHEAAGFRMMAAEIQLHMAYHAHRCIKLIAIPDYVYEPQGFVIDKMARRTSQVALFKKMLIEKDMSELLNKLVSIAKEEPDYKRLSDDETFDFDQILSTDVNILNEGFRIHNKYYKFDLYIEPRVRGGARKQNKKLSPYNIFVSKHRRAGKSMKEVGALWQKTKQL